MQHVEQRGVLMSGADAIHPGYGFLSESPELAAAAEQAGITFVGPRTQTLIDLGDKVASRKLAIFLVLTLIRPQREWRRCAVDLG